MTEYEYVVVVQRNDGESERTHVSDDQVREGRVVRLDDGEQIVASQARRPTDAGPALIIAEAVSPGSRRLGRLLRVVRAWCARGAHPPISSVFRCDPGYLNRGAPGVTRP